MLAVVVVVVIVVVFIITVDSTSGSSSCCVISYKVTSNASDRIIINYFLCYLLLISKRVFTKRSINMERKIGSKEEIIFRF